ncbi:MAG TPA: 6-phosphogluconolactonase [Candidatus Saccharimonadaceae bacterium]|nr:6-phosphogluconolactonase [Candidatus Saccharimonadaceae bacterium]
MKLIKQTNNPAESLTKILHESLSNHRRVIWLVSGGSNVPISIKAMDQLDEALTERLVVMQIDERYVNHDSDDCNWHQLIAGGFALKKATSFPILLPDSPSRELTRTAYNETLHREFALADCSIGQFGIGSDGHTAGIKPHSPATDSRELVADYTWEDYERITLTFPAIRQLTTAVAFVYGEDKRPVLDQLASDSPPPFEVMPASILRTIPNSIIYNDHIESEVAV